MAKVDLRFLNHLPPVDQVGVEERVARLNKRSIKNESKMEALKLAISMMDLTMEVEAELMALSYNLLQANA